MVEQWILFALVCAFIGVTGWCMWTEIGEWWDHHLHEELLDELWDDDE